jgi:PAS domain S-box-containing protein
MPNDETTNILIVDDKANNIFALEEILSRPGRNLMRATNGNDALKTVLNSDVDLIILDVQMPDMDGFEVAQILKSNKRTKDIPIIFASAEKKEHKFMMKGFEEGAFDYLYKPLDPQITEAKVSVLLQLHLQKKELTRKNTELEKYALLINNSADLICIINAKTLDFEEVNYTVNTMFGYTVEDIKGTSILSYIPAENHNNIQKLCEENSAKFSFEAMIFDKEGTTKWLHWNIINKDGFWFANARDVTQQKNADEEIRLLNADLERNVAQLEITNKDLESFSYSVSHDLRTPLRSISGYSTIILEEYQEQFDAELKHLFGMVQGSAKKMGALIDDLLAFSKLGRKTVKKAKVDFNDLVSEVLKDLKGTGNIKAEISIHSLKSADADRALLYQVFVNLISNAIKYSSKKTTPQIEISFLENPEEYIYYIKDNGSGFNMQYSHKLFGVFQRLHKENEFEGTGVGLAIVQRIINKHGGRIWAEGEIDKGATFYFSLPKPLIAQD